MSELSFKNPRLITDSSKLEPGSVSWNSPSNIALIKYWGKHGDQMPNNPSISLTLSEARTETTIHYSPKTGADQGIAMEFLYDGQPKPDFEERILSYLERLTKIFPFLRQLNLKIDSKNTFPHSAGIASSASAMSALALCLCTLEDRLFKDLPADADFRRKASYVARLGSGSASRSIYSGGAVWGKHGSVENSSDLFAVSIEDELHPIFQDLRDTILLIDTGHKPVSSRAGHSLMTDNQYADVRYAQARRRMMKMMTALRTGDWETFARITESEALTLHALMMMSQSPYLLIAPNTIEAINRLWAFRKKTNLPICFTLDAGPNLHLLYPADQAAPIDAFIQEELMFLCESGQILYDQVGKGPIEK